MITAPAVELLHPLPLFFQAVDRVLPEFEVLEASALPSAAYRLLAHAGDMTSKLEEYFESTMLLRVLQCQHTPEFYRREVLLYGAKDGVPVEYGAIEIELSAFPANLREEIVAARLPLGGLLNRSGLRYRSAPRGFLKFAPCPWLTELFGVQDQAVHYGRSNVLLGADGETLARIVEILRPVD